MPDPRWDDPSKPPVSNGPFSQTTPPAIPQFRLATDGQLIEFLLSFPMHVVDDKPWNVLECKLGNRIVSIHKPIPIMHRYEPPGRVGNETPDVFCSIIRAGCAPDTIQQKYANQSEVWPIVEQLLAWIRVKCRHYWLLHGHAGFDTLCRGSVLTQEGSQIGQRNFATYGRNLVVRPLEQDLWLTFTNEINGNIQPPVSESIFCDALISAVAGDEVKAVLELGVAAEIEITQLLTDISKMPPKTPQKIKFATKGARDKFYEKLAEWPQRLGLQNAKDFDPTGNFKQWFDLVKELYKFRGSVAHSGRLGPTTGQNVTNYLMATNALFDYCREQKTKVGVPVYSYPATRRPFEQIVLFAAGEISSMTNTAIGTLR
jgi:hypothetical protein